MKIRVLSAIAIALILGSCSNGNKTTEADHQHQGGPKIGQPAMGGGERPEPTGELKTTNGRLCLK